MEKKKACIIRRQEAERGFQSNEPINYPLPDGSTMSFVVEGRVGPKKGPLHSHEQEEFWFIISGSAKAIFGDEEVEVVAGDLVIIPAGMPHTVWSETNYQEYRELAFMAQTGKPDTKTMEIEAKRTKKS